MARWRLAAHLQGRDWAAVIIDLLIVIVGVFLGIQASNWNTERRDREQAAAYRDRLRTDLQDDFDQLTKREQYWQGSADAGHRALRFAEEGRVDRDDWRTLLAFYRAGEIWVYSPRYATYNEMVSSGRLDLVGDDLLKSQISSYYSDETKRTQVLFDKLPPYREDIRAAVPSRLQAYILERCGGPSSTGYRTEDCPPPGDAEGIAAIDRKIAADPKLIGELRSWMTDLYYITGVGSYVRRNAAQLIVAIDKQRR